MAQHPYIPNASDFEDESINRQSALTLTLTQTSPAPVSMHPVPDNTHDAMVDSFVAATSVYGHFQEHDNLTGGPPAYVSIYDGALSVVSKATRTSVLEQMNTICPDVQPFPDDDIHTHCLLQSGDSSSDTSDDNSFDIDIEIWQRLRAWSFDHHVGRDAMSDLLSLFVDIGHDSWPTDWRTVLARLNSHDEQCNIHSPSHHASVTHVCGSCFLVPFPDDVVANATACTACGVASLNCTRYQCQVRCVVTSKLGKRSIATLSPCSVCLISSLSFPMHRTFHFSLKTYLERAFADRKFAYDCLAPFRGTFDIALSHARGPPTISFHSDWLEAWRAKMQSVSAPSELCHATRFYNHPIWTNYGPRSLLLVLSLDWFPPFKSRDYTVGVLTATVANLSTTHRADRANIWILSVLEGPREPAHTFYCLAPVFLELRDLEQRGMEVYDALTECTIRVHLSCGPVSADVPACAKLGDHTGHSGFQPCISCNHTGSVCGCKTNADEEPVGRWNNSDYTQGRPKLLSGTIRPKRKGEHVCFVDSELVLQKQQRPDLVHRAGQLSMARFMERKDYTNAAFDRLRRTTRSNGVSPMLLLDPSSFSFTIDMTIDAMHTVLKGVVQRLWRLSMNIEFKAFAWNIHHTKGNFDKMKERLVSFKFPSGHTNPTTYADRANSLKAEEMYVVVRVCGWILFDSLISDNAVRVWYLFCRLYTNLLHTHVSRSWIQHVNGLQLCLSKAHNSFHDVFGPCHMPSNFHRVLHARLDFDNWGPMRTHWTFPYERLYGALMLATRSSNR